MLKEEDKSFVVTIKAIKRVLFRFNENGSSRSAQFDIKADVCGRLIFSLVM